MIVAIDYLDTHTYPIIPAVKKSPSDIFVVFCLRSERLKNLVQFLLRVNKERKNGLGNL